MAGRRALPVSASRIGGLSSHRGPAGAIRRRPSGPAASGPLRDHRDFEAAPSCESAPEGPGGPLKARAAAGSNRADPAPPRSRLGNPRMSSARPRRAPPALLILAIATILAPPARADLPKVPEGFEVRLVATVPAVEYPCQVATAPDGALYVAEDPMDQVGPYEAKRRPHPRLPRRPGPGRLRRRLPRHLRHGLARRPALRLAHALPDRPPRRRRRRQGRPSQGPVQGPRPDRQPGPERPHRLGPPVRHGRLPLHRRRRQGHPARDRARRPDDPDRGRGRRPLPARRHRHRGRLHRHPQPPRTQPRRPRQHLHLRQHRRRRRLVDPRHPPHRQRLLRLSLRLPRPPRPDAPPDGRVRRRLPLRRPDLQGRRLAREVPRRRLLGRVGQGQGPGLPVRPRRLDLQGRRGDRLRHPRRPEGLPPDRPGPLATTARPSTSPTGTWAAGAPSRRRSAASSPSPTRASDQDPPPRQGLGPDRGPDQAARPPLVQRADAGPGGDHQEGLRGGLSPRRARPCATRRPTPWRVGT